MIKIGSGLILIFQLAVISHAWSESKTSPIAYTIPARVISSGTPSEALRVNLYLLNKDNSIAIADGVYAQYNRSFSDRVDIKDATKLTNISENFALQRDGVLLALERRQIIDLADTLFFNLTRTRQRDYQLVFIPDKLNHPGLAAFLQDSYLNTSTPVDLNSTTAINFKVSADAGSSAPKRFRVVFALLMVPLPLTFAPVKVYRKNKDIHLEHILQNDVNIQLNTVGVPVYGTRFGEPAMLPANDSKIGYQWMDAKSVTAQNASSIAVFPNPVISNVLNLRLLNLSKGIYTISLFDGAGRLVLSRQVQHDEGRSAETLQISKIFARGNYVLRFTSPGKAPTAINILYE